MKFLRKAAVWLANEHNRRTLLWKTRKILLVAAAIVETVLRDTIDDVLPAAG